MAQARSALIFAAALVLACDVASPPATSPGAAAPASGAVRPAGGPSSEPSPLPSARPGLRATAVGSLPALFRYVALDTPLADGVHTRLWLVDLGSRRAPALAAEWDAPVAPVGGWSASADGRTLLVSAVATRSRVALSLVRPETGETRVLFEDPGAVAVAARVSPDGSRYAFTKYPAQGGMDLGIWSARTAGGEPARITDPTTTTTTPQMPLAWSPDGTRLAFTRDLERTEVRVIPADGGAEILAGPGDRASWRSAAPELLVAQPVGPGSVIYTIDLATGKTNTMGKFDVGHVSTIAWDQRGKRFAFDLTESASREASQGIWLWRTGDANPVVQSGKGRFFAPQWSPDGTLISALGGGDDARLQILDLLSGRQLSVLCRRGGTPPADCV